MSMKNRTVTAENVTVKFALNEKAGYYNRLIDLEQIGDGVGGGEIYDLDYPPSSKFEKLLFKSIQSMYESAYYYADEIHGYNGEYERTGRMADSIKLKFDYSGNEIDALLFIDDTVSRPEYTESKYSEYADGVFNYGVYEELGRPSNNNGGEEHKFLEPAFHQEQRNITRVIGALLGHYITRGR